MKKRISYFIMAFAIAISGQTTAQPKPVSTYIDGTTDVDPGNSSAAFLYLIVNGNKWKMVDEVPIANRKFRFENVTPGKFVVMVRPTDKKYVVCYSETASCWSGAYQIDFPNVHAIVVNLKLSSVSADKGMLGGRVLEGDNYKIKEEGNILSRGTPVPGVPVKSVGKVSGKVYGNTVTNEKGEYSFQNLPFNEALHIIIEIPGLELKSTYEKVLSTGTPSISDLDFTADSWELFLGIFLLNAIISASLIYF